MLESPRTRPMKVNQGFKTMSSPWIAILLLSLTGCGKPISTDSSSLASVENKTINVQDYKKALMERSRAPLAVLANALGYGWTGGCHGGVGEDMNLVWDTQGSGHWISNFDGSAACGAANQDPNRRLNIKYDFYQSIKSIEPLMARKTVKKSEIKRIDRIFFGALPSAREASPQKSYTSQETISNTVTDTISGSMEMTLEFSAGLFGFGSKTSTKFNIGGSHATARQSMTLEGDTLGAGDSIPIPANHCAIVDIMRISTVTTVPYTATVQVLASAELSGFLRATACGGNFHKTLRGNASRPGYTYKLGKAGKESFWGAINDDKNLNNSDFDYIQASANHDCSDHGKDIDWSIAVLKQSFTSSPVQLFKMRGYAENVKGTAIKMEPHIYPANSAQCKHPDL